MSIARSVSALERSRTLQPRRLSVILAAPRGFCAGVRRAIDAVEEAIEVHGPPVFVRRAIVHNLRVVRDLERKGAVFVEDLAEVPSGGTVILSAHGVPLSVTKDARARQLRFFDAVCPLVAKVHREVARHHRAGRHVVLIGHRDHPEIVGTLGQIPAGCVTVVASPGEVDAIELPAKAEVAYAVQTTYSLDDAAQIVAALRRRFSRLAGPSSSDICYATTNRQTAVKQIAPMVDALIVVGESFSSNACRLAEVARAAGCPAVQLLPDASGLDWAMLGRSRSVGITAAASTPEAAVSGIIERLSAAFELTVEDLHTVRENTVFKPVRIARAASPLQPLF